MSKYKESEPSVYNGDDSQLFLISLLFLNWLELMEITSNSLITWYFTFMKTITSPGCSLIESKSMQTKHNSFYCYLPNSGDKPFSVVFFNLVAANDYN